MKNVAIFAAVMASVLALSACEKQQPTPVVVEAAPTPVVVTPAPAETTVVTPAPADTTVTPAPAESSAPVQK